jgi:hypothetical protein
MEATRVPGGKNHRPVASHCISLPYHWTLLITFSISTIEISKCHEWLIMRGLLISGNNLSASMVCCTAHDEVGVVDTTLCDKVCQWLATGRWFFYFSYLVGSVLLMEATRVPGGKNHRPVASHWQTLSHNVVSTTPTSSCAVQHTMEALKLLNLSKSRIGHWNKHIVPECMEKRCFFKNHKAPFEVILCVYIKYKYRLIFSCSSRGSKTITKKADRNNGLITKKADRNNGARLQWHVTQISTFQQFFLNNVV